MFVCRLVISVQGVIIIDLSSLGCIVPEILKSIKNFKRNFSCVSGFFCHLTKVMAVGIPLLTLKLRLISSYAVEIATQLYENQRYCKILVDEVHIRPAIRYQCNHVIGFSVDEPTKAAKTILALMVCPILGRPAFVVRLIPVFSLKHELL